MKCPMCQIEIELWSKIVEGDGKSYKGELSDDLMIKCFRKLINNFKKHLRAQSIIHKDSNKTKFDWIKEIHDNYR